MQKAPEKMILSHPSQSSFSSYKDLGCSGGVQKPGDQVAQKSAEEIEGI